MILKLMKESGLLKIADGVRPWNAGICHTPITALKKSGI
jgi:hypothetical protein